MMLKPDFGEENEGAGFLLQRSILIKQNDQAVKALRECNTTSISVSIKTMEKERGTTR